MKTTLIILSLLAVQHSFAGGYAITPEKVCYTGNEVMDRPDLAVLRIGVFPVRRYVADLAVTGRCAHFRGKTRWFNMNDKRTFRLHTDSLAVGSAKPASKSWKGKFGLKRIQIRDPHYVYAEVQTDDLESLNYSYVSEPNIGTYFTIEPKGVELKVYFSYRDEGRSWYELPSLI